MTLATTRPPPLELDPADIEAEYDRRGFADLSDEQCFELAARVVAGPKRDGANSFILHAPLELMARRALLAHVAPARRGAIRRRMIWVAAAYEEAADPVPDAPPVAFESATAARDTLLAGIRERDLDRVDAAASGLGNHASAEDIMKCAPATADSLAAAGHASIYFFHLARHAAASRAALGLLRPLVREIARIPQWRIEWVAPGVAARGHDAERFARALAETPRLGIPGSDFVYPIVHQVDEHGRARDAIEPNLPLDASAAARAVSRVAAWSMIQDEPDSAPYGWTHCLTLPQAVLGIGPWLPNPAVASALAATYVVGFRAALGSRDIDLAYVPEPVSVSVRAALEAGPATAAAAVFHASETELSAIVPELAARAGAHEDAHLAKFTLACFDAAGFDPSQRHLYLAAAAYLHAWWIQAE